MIKSYRFYFLTLRVIACLLDFTFTKPSSASLTQFLGLASLTEDMKRREFCPGIHNPYTLNYSKYSQVQTKIYIEPSFILFQFPKSVHTSGNLLKNCPMFGEKKIITLLICTLHVFPSAQVHPNHCGH